VLCLKGISPEVEIVDLPRKSEFPERLSPYGRVPVLEHGRVRVFESSIICEYLEEVFPRPALMPRDPVGRAEARFWIDFCNSRFMPAYFNLLRSKPGRVRSRLRNVLSDHLRFIERLRPRFASGEGSYWIGQAISLADTAFYPFFERFAPIEEFRGVRISDEHVGLRNWLDLMRAHECVSRHTRSREDHVEYFRSYYADDG